MPQKKDDTFIKTILRRNILISLLMTSLLQMPDAPFSICADKSRIRLAKLI